VTGLEGEFVAVVYDEPAGEVLVVNDRFGLYPHYCVHGAFGFALAPEIKALPAVPGFEARLDITAVSQFVRYQQLLGDRTWFEGAWVLPPASLLRIRVADWHLDRTRYWDLGSVQEQSSITFRDAVDEGIRRVERSVDKRIDGHLRVGVYLSGGLDSRLLAGLAHGKVQQTTFTYGAAGCRDVVIAAQIAAALGTDHRWFPLRDGTWVLDHAARHLSVTEGLHGWHHAHGISTLQDARREEIPWLSGWEGGTVLGGTLDHYRDAPYRQPTDHPTLLQNFHHGLCMRFTWPGLTDEEASALLNTAAGTQLRERARESLSIDLNTTASSRPDLRADVFYIRNVVRRSLQMQVVLARSELHVSCPFFDYDLIDFLYALPNRIRTNPLFRRTVLTQRVPHLAAIPRDRDLRPPHTGRGHVLSDRVRRAGRRLRQHLGARQPESPTLYADYEHYLRTDLREWAEDLLLRPRTILSEFFEPRVVRQLWDLHVSGRQLWTIGKVAPLMTLELFLRALADEGHQEAVGRSPLT
jgi:asparagine synthase (glutamine-hydrolysing)